MKRTVLVLLALTLLAFLTSCSSDTPASNPESSITVVNLQVTPGLEHWLTDVAACADPIPDFGVYTQVLSQEDLSLEEADLILRLGERLETDPYTAVMGMEEFVIVAGGDVPIASISIESLRGIFSGEITTWGELPELEASGTEIDQTIQVFSYPEGHELRQFFQEYILESNSIFADVQVFSTLDTLESFLESEPYGIAYLLESQVPSGVSTLMITGAENYSTQIYVLAITSQEPTGELMELLLCLQDSQ